MRIEEEHPDIFQNIEIVVTRHFRASPHLTEYAVTRVYEALIDFYSSENIGRQPRTHRLDEDEQQLLTDTKEICDWRLGRIPVLRDNSWAPVLPSRHTDLDTLIRCLKRLRKSVQTWTKRSGRQGYLRFISNFT